MFDVETGSQTIQTFFEETAESEARETKFVQRASKMNGSKFLETLVFGFSENPEASLNDLAQMADDLGVEITAQGLDERLTDEAVAFLQTMAHQSLELFRNEIPLDIELLQQCTAVDIVDSSIIALPDSLQAEYPGCGGDGPDASLKVQLVWNALDGNLRQIVFQPGRTPDQAYTDDLAQLAAGTLNISDLGYFSLTRFETIVDRQAYFLSRLNLQTALFDQDDASVDLLKWLRSESGSLLERELLVGAEAQLRCRVVAVCLPQEVADRRRQKAKEKARKKGRTPRARHLALLGWSIFITNVPSTMLKAQQVVALYPLRWQIELIFKLWKSECALERVAGLRRERVLCELYAKLIGVLMVNYLMASQRLTDQVELSLIKATRVFRRHAVRLAQRLPALQRLIVILHKVSRCMQRFGGKTKRQKEPSTYRMLERVFAEATASSGAQQTMAA